MGGQGIRIALDQGGVDQVPILQGIQPAQPGQSVLLCVQKQLLRLCGGLHRHYLAGQILQGIDIAVGAHCHHLTAVQIRPCPLVFFLAAVHGKTAPDAVDGVVFHQFLLLFPVDGHKFCPAAQPPERLGGQFYVNAGGRAVRTHIIEGRVVIAAHYDDRHCCRIAVGFSGMQAAAKQRRTHCQRQQTGCWPQFSSVFFHGFFPTIFVSFCNRMLHVISIIKTVPKEKQKIVFPADFTYFCKKNSRSACERSGSQKTHFTCGTSYPH